MQSVLGYLFGLSSSVVVGDPTGDDEVGGLLAAEVQRHERVGPVQRHLERHLAPLAQHVQLRRLARVLLADQVVERDALPRPARGDGRHTRAQKQDGVVRRSLPGESWSSAVMGC